MAFRKPDRKPEFADLKGILAQTKNTESSEYQTIQEIIERLSLFKKILENELKDLRDNDNTFAPKTASYITENDESSNLPNSNQLVAGGGITLDYSVAGKLTISASGGGGMVPMTTGEYPAEIMYIGQTVMMIHYNGS